jgi:hypothetical protein
VPVAEDGISKERNERNKRKRRLASTAIMKRVALKFCGGCDCTYDRSMQWERIRAEAVDKIQWVLLDDAHYDAVLMIHGCPVACPEKHLDPLYAKVLVSVKDDRTESRHIVARLMEKVFIPHLVCGP